MMMDAYKATVTMHLFLVLIEREALEKPEEIFLIPAFSLLITLTIATPLCCGFPFSVI